MPLTTCPDCGRELSEMAPHCPGCGRPMSTMPEPPPPSEDGKRVSGCATGAVGCAALVAFLALCVLGFCGMLMLAAPKAPAPQPLSAADRTTIESALRSKGYSVTGVELTSGDVLGVTVEVTNPLVAGNAAALRGYAKNAVITARNSVYGRSKAQLFRITLNGPSPGPGLVNRYGIGYFDDSGGFSWKPAVNE